MSRDSRPRLTVHSQSQKCGVAEVTIGGPLDESYLRDERQSRPLLVGASERGRPEAAPLQDQQSRIVDHTGQGSWWRLLAGLGRSGGRS